MTIQPYNPGETVKVSYTGYYIVGEVISHDVHSGWVELRQDIGFNMDGSLSSHNDYTDAPVEDRPIQKAADEYVRRMDEDLAPDPFSPEGFRASWERALNER